MSKVVKLVPKKEEETYEEKQKRMKEERDYNNRRVLKQYRIKHQRRNTIRPITYTLTDLERRFPEERYSRLCHVYILIQRHNFYIGDDRPDDARKLLKEIEAIITNLKSKEKYNV